MTCRMGILLVLCLAASATAGPSAGPASRPAKTPADATLTPIGWLRAYNTAMLNGDKHDLLARSHATTEDGKKLAEAITAHDATVGRLLKLAKAKLDDKSALLIGRSLGDIGNDDIGEATVTVDGDRAVVSAGRGVGDTHLIQRDGQWKLDFDHAAAQQLRMGMTIAERLDLLKTKTTAAEAAITTLKDGQVKTVDDVLYIIRREMSE